MRELQIILKSLSHLGVTDEQLVFASYMNKNGARGDLHTINDIHKAYHDGADMIYVSANKGDLLLDYAIPRESIQYMVIAEEVSEIE